MDSGTQIMEGKSTLKALAHRSNFAKWLAPRSNFAKQHVSIRFWCQHTVGWYQGHSVLNYMYLQNSDAKVMMG